MRNPRLGSYVASKHYPYQGRVTAIYACFEETPVDRKWLRAQSIEVTEDDLNGPWYSVLIEPEGMVLVPLSALLAVDPFPFTNPSSSTYFEEQR